MKVVFRVDASIDIGTGHVMRCLTLAEKLSSQGHHCSFICRDLVGHLGNSIKAKGFELFLLTANKKTKELFDKVNNGAYADWLCVSWQDDAEQTLEVLTGNKIDWLVVDHYALDVRWEQKIRPEVERIMVIDDIADRSHDCNLLLDQNLGRQSEDYDGLVPLSTERLIGPHYALLRPEFSLIRDKSLQRRQHPELKRILISFGGVDRTNVTGQVLEALSDVSLPSDTKLDIIMGASAPWLMQVQAQAEILPFEATVSVNVTNMSERMCLADLSIGAAGSTSWERCCLGLPAIMIILADNQRLIGEALARYNCALLVEDTRITNNLGILVNRFVESGQALQDIARNAMDICDGGGAARIVSLMNGSEVV